jgi:hypothetical protein
MGVNLQNAVVAGIVVAAALYVLWALMPARWRSRLALRLLASRWPLGAGLRARLLRASRAGSGCGCSGCDQAPGTPASAVQVVKVLRRRPSS